MCVAGPGASNEGVVPASVIAVGELKLAVSGTDAAGAVVSLDGVPARSESWAIEGATTLVPVRVQSVIVSVVAAVTVYVAAFKISVVGVVMAVLSVGTTQVVV